MTIFINRNNSRSYFESSIMYSGDLGGKYNSAKIRNFCVNGICFETDCALKPGYDICIKMINHSPDLDYSPEAYKVYRATVKWCREIEESSRYGIGVQFFEPLNQKPC